MKSTRKLGAITLLIFTCFLTASDAAAQCVTCAPRGQDFICAASSRGGKECMTADDAKTCAIRLPCGRVAGDEGGSEGGVDQSAPSGGADLPGGAEIDAETVRAVAALHPRLAAAVLFLNSRGLVGQQVRIFMSPEALTPADVERRLKQRPDGGNSPKPLTALIASPKSQESAPPVVLESAGEVSSEARTATVRLRVLRGFKDDPGYTSLEMTLARDGGAGAWRVSQWQVR